MELKYYSLKNLRQQIVEIAKKHLDTQNYHNYRIFFFGSRVRGDNRERADIDLGIEGSDELSPRLKFEIQDELDQLPLLYKIDLVDFKKVSSEFKREALKNIEYVV